jgi:hypothetical protein
MDLSTLYTCLWTNLVTPQTTTQGTGEGAGGEEGGRGRPPLMLTDDNLQGEIQTYTGSGRNSGWDGDIAFARTMTGLALAATMDDIALAGTMRVLR